MNVKTGDLAILIKSHAGNEGAIFEVLEFEGDFDGHKNMWHVIGAHLSKNHLGLISFDGYAADSSLRPVSGLPMDENIDDEIAA